MDFIINLLKIRTQTFLVIVPIVVLIIGISFFLKIVNPPKEIQEDNQKVVKKFIEVFPKIKNSHNTIMKYVISENGQVYEEIQMTRRRNKPHVSGGASNTSNIPIMYNEEKVHLEDLKSFFYYRNDSSIHYKFIKGYYKGYRFIYYMNDIPNECIKCDLVLKDSSLRYVKDFCCVLEDNWIISSKW